MGLGIPCTRVVVLDRVNESEGIRWEGRGVFGEAKDAFDVGAEFGTALQEVGWDLSIANAPGRICGHRLLVVDDGGGGGMKWRRTWSWRPTLRAGRWYHGGDDLDRLRDPEAERREGWEGRALRNRSQESGWRKKPDQS
jgi:hypothetical protein